MYKVIGEITILFQQKKRFIIDLNLLNWKPDEMSPNMLLHFRQVTKGQHTKKHEMKTKEWRKINNDTEKTHSQPPGHSCAQSIV